MTSKRSLLTHASLLLVLSLLFLVGCSQNGGLLGPDGDAAGTSAPSPLPFPGGGDRGDHDDDNSSRAGRWIGPQGGSVDLGYCELDIPAGALTRYTYISITQDDPNVASVELGPDGQQFLVPITIKMSLLAFQDYMDANDLSAEDLFISLYDEELNQWVKLPSEIRYDDDDWDDDDDDDWDDDDDDDYDGAAIWAQTTHFSRYALSE